MPNMSGAFLDTNPDVIVEDAPNELEEVAADYPYEGLHLARAHATPSVEFASAFVGPLASVRILGADASRKRVTIGAYPNNVSGTGAACVLVSSINLSGMLNASLINTGGFPIIPVPAFALPQANAPLVIDSQDEIWLYGCTTGSAVQSVNYIVERYSEH